VVEDQLSQSKYAAADAQAKIEGLTKLSHTMEQQRDAAVDAQEKLRADLKNMQQSMAASYRLEASQGIGVGVDADTAIRLAQAKFEAKDRQQTNKIEFLKSQLTAEQVTSDLFITSIYLYM
jgi:hypothetical protein